MRPNTKRNPLSFFDIGIRLGIPMKYELDKNKQFHGIKRFIQIPPAHQILG